MKDAFATSRICFLLTSLLLSTIVASCAEQEQEQEQEQQQDEAPAAGQSTPQPIAESPAPRAQAPDAAVATQSGAYRVRLRPQNPPVEIGKRQLWVANITDASGADFTPNALHFDGGMPGHGHGLPSAPEFTRHLGGSDYLLEGLALNMPGDWRFVVTVGGPAGVDNAVFDFNIQPGGLAATAPTSVTSEWSDSELALINSLRLDALAKPSDPSNRFLRDPRAIALGEELFNEVGLSATRAVSCATCHQAATGFADGKPLGFGSATTKRHTPTLVGVAHANWFYWDGRRDSLWAQALTPIETPGEMDNNRTDAVRFVTSAPAYKTRFAELLGQSIDVSDTNRFPAGASPFGAGKLAWHRMAEQDRQLLNNAFTAIGKVIAAYETTLQHQPGRFDTWANNLLTVQHGKHNNSASGAQPLSADEKAGLHLFLDLPTTQCLRCHNGPLFSNLGFHNVATSEPVTIESGTAGRKAERGTYGTHDFGRMLGLQSVLADPFNCSGSYSDATNDECEDLRFARRQNLGETIDGAFKVPSLRNLQATAPYFHDGRFATLDKVIDHYRNQLGDSPLRVSEVPDITLTDSERDQLVAFLNAL